MGVIKTLIIILSAVFFSIFIFSATIVSAAETIKIGTVLSMSDAASQSGEKAMQLAIKQINASGGLLGRKLEAIVIDDEMKPEKAAAALEKLATVDKVDVFCGGMSSALTLAMVPGMLKYGKVTVWVGGASSKIEEAMAGKEWFFHLYPWDYQIWQMMSKGMAQILQKYGNVKIKKVFLAYEAGPYGMSLFQGAKATFEAARIEIRGESFVTTALGGGDYRKILRNAKIFAPDLFLWVGYSNDAIPLMEQSRDIGFHPPIYAGWPPAWPEDVAALPLSDGVMFFSFWDEVMKNKSNPSKVFSDAYYKEYKHAAPSLAAPLAYTNLMIVAEAIKRAGTLEKSALIKALEATDYVSPMGDRFTFRKSKYIDHQAYSQLKFMQWQKGKTVVVWPWEFATAKLVYPFPDKGSVAVDDKKYASKGK